MVIENSVENLKILLNKAKQGDQNAFGDIYNSYFVPLYRYIYVRVGRRREDAEELTQEVFLRIFGNLDNLQVGKSNPLAYFYTAARNILIDFYRKSGKSDVAAPEEAMELVEDTGQSPAEFVESEENSKMVREAINYLTEEQQEVIILKFINELGNREIAEVTGKTEEAIRQLQHRALVKMREFFKKHGR